MEKRHKFNVASNSNLSFDHSVFSLLSSPFCTHYHSIWPHHQITTTNTVATCNVDDSSAAISVNGYEDRLNTSTGGQKAILAISEDNESAVIKYRSDQDMSSIGEYQDSSSKGSFQSSHFFRIDHPVAILSPFLLKKESIRVTRPILLYLEQVIFWRCCLLHLS